jgi:hypothetical protein
MSEHHDNGAKISSKIILSSWKSELKWRNKFISDSIHFCHSSGVFPSPDRAFEDQKKKTNILLEFKPQKGESKRGIMTGLGQCIGYLNKAHASVFVAPAYIDDFDMGKFLTDTFKKFIFKKLPIALFTFDSFDGENFKNFKLRCNIHDGLYGRSNIIYKSNKPYWAWWRDWSLDACYKLLKSANKITDKDNRSDKIWDEFFFKYFAPPETLNTLEPIPSTIIGLDGNKMIAFKDKKKRLKDQFEKQELTLDDALNLLKKEYSKDEVENLYRNYKKNNSIFLDHNNLWDEKKFVTPLGKKFLSRVENFDEKIDKLKDEFAQIILVQGKHHEFIEEIKEITLSLKKIENDKDYVESLEVELDKRGHIAKNPNRSQGKAPKRKFLQAEKQIWGNLGLIYNASLAKEKRSTRYLFKDEGYKFNFKKINNLVKEFYANYGYESDITLKNSELIN